MTEFYGTTRVTANPQKKRTGTTREAMLKSEPADGYFVTYANGYEEWQEKAVFEAIYKPSTAMGLEGALAAVKDGHTVTRASQEWRSRGLTWNKKDGLQGRNIAPGGPAVMMATLDDVFADDWMIVT